MKFIFKKINNFLKKSSRNYSFTLRAYQYLRAFRLLFNSSFRSLYLNTKKGDICIDMGANIGDASLIFWLRGAKAIYSIEPHPIAYKELSKNLKGIKNIRLYNIAISNKVGLEKLYLHQEVLSNKYDDDKLLKYSQSSSLLDNKENLGEVFFEIKTTTMEKFLNDQKIIPTFIKCDIEGAEYQIYNEFVKLAKSYKLRKLLIECHAKKYKNFESQHNMFLKKIKDENLGDKFNLSWH